MTNDELDDLMRREAQSYNAPPDTPREAMWERIEQARAATRIVPIAGAAGARRLKWLQTAAGIAAVLAIGFGIGRLSRGGAAAPESRRIATLPGASTNGAPDTSSPSDGDQSLSPDVSVRGTGSYGANEASSREAGTAKPALARSSGVDRTVGRAEAARGLAVRGVSAFDDDDDRSAYRLAVVEHMARTEVLLTTFRSQSQGSANDAQANAQLARLSRELLQTTRLLLATRTRDDAALTHLLEDLELVLMQIIQYTSDGRHGDLESINQSLDRSNVLPKLRSTIPAGAPVPAGT